MEAGALLPPPGYVNSTNGEGLIFLLSSLVKFAIVVAAVYAFINLIMAGFMFIGAGGEPKNIAKAWEKIWQSLVGLLVIAGSFVIAIIIGALIFGPSNALILINPIIYTP